MNPTTSQIFLLSPAYCGGRRAKILLRPGSELPIACRLRSGTLDLGTAFAFMSGLYFRGKLGYAEKFGRRHPSSDPAVLIITPTRGLQPPSMPVTAGLLHEFADGDVSVANAAYRSALERDVADMAGRVGDTTRVVLLGSVATGKYVDVLLPLLGPRLHYPSSFVGRGDMSRGGLLLRSAASGVELDYQLLEPGARPRGPRPPKLDPLTRPGSKLES